MIVAITGGSGFIGRHVTAHHLALGDEVRMLSRQPRTDLGGRVSFHLGSLGADSAALGDFVRGADVLYHCAGETRDVSNMRAVHVDGTARLLRTARGRIGRWVQLSSVGVYGMQRKGKISEDSPVAPAGEYETTKAESDRLVAQAGADDGLDYSILRPSIVFGPGMSNRSLHQLVSAIDRGWFCFAGRAGASASANYIPVSNVVDALWLCATRPASRGRIYNLSDHCSMEAFVGVIAKSLGKPAPHLRLPETLLRVAAYAFAWLPGFPLTPSRVDALSNRCVYPIARIQKELGYAHRTSMQQGLAELVEQWKRAS